LLEHVSVFRDCVWILSWWDGHRVFEWIASRSLHEKYHRRCFALCCSINFFWFLFFFFFFFLLLKDPWEHLIAGVVGGGLMYKAANFKVEQLKEHEVMRRHVFAAVKMLIFF
jgi:hypothetical protein